MRHPRMTAASDGDVKATLVQPVMEGTVTLTMSSEAARAVLALVGKCASSKPGERSVTFSIFQTLNDLLGWSDMEVLYVDRGGVRQSSRALLVVERPE